MPSCQNSDFLCIFNFQLLFLDILASHFLEITMLIR